MAEIIEYAESISNNIGQRLLKGEVGIFPCDTIYGLCAKVSEENASRIYQIKKRPENKSFIQLMDKRQIEQQGLVVPEDIISLWPAPFTAIVYDKSGSTVALRVPNDSFILSILPISGPIYSTSVNFSGSPSLQDPEDIINSFSSLVDFIVVKKDLEKGLSSTLIDVTKKPYRIIRQGAYRF